LPFYIFIFVGWLPLLDLMVYIFVFSLGYGSMVWITVIEILPAHVRELCNRWAGLLRLIV
jgi:hypothetical protein